MSDLQRFTVFYLRNAAFRDYMIVADALEIRIQI